MLAGLAQFYEVRIFGEATGIQKHGNVVFVTYGSYRSKVFHADRLSASGIVRHCDHAQRYPVPADAFDELDELFHVHVPLERVTAGGVLALFDDEIDGFCSGVLDVGARRVEVRVVGDHLALTTHQFEQDALARPALMGG